MVSRKSMTHYLFHWRELYSCFDQDSSKVLNARKWPHLSFLLWNASQQSYVLLLNFSFSLLLVYITIYVTIYEYIDSLSKVMAKGFSVFDQASQVFWVNSYSPQRVFNRSVTCSSLQGVAHVMIQSFQLSSCTLVKVPIQLFHRSSFRPGSDTIRQYFGLTLI